MVEGPGRTEASTREWTVLMGLGNIGATVKGQKKAAPQSAYTRDVIARGSQAVRDRAAAAQMQRTAAPQSLEFLRESGYGGPPQRSGGNAQYNAWLAQQGFNPDYEVTFGRTRKGAYSGFKTEGELKSAIKGRSQQMRGEARSQAGQQIADAGQQLDRVTSDYDVKAADAEKRAQETMLDWLGSFDALAKAGAYSKQGGFMPIEGKINPGGKYHDQELDPVLAGQERAQREAAGQASRDRQLEFANEFLGKHNAALVDQSQTGKYSRELDDWLSSQSEPLVSQMEAGQMIDATPLSAYATKAGAEYGVDPNLISGWYDDASDVSDFGVQRNQEAIDQYGMPYSDLQSWIAQQGRQDASAEADAARQQDTGTERQIADDVFQATGMDAQQLATAADVTPEQLWQIVQDPTYQQASADMAQVLQDPDFDPEGQGAEDVNGILDQLRVDPVLYRLIQAQYGSYLS
jgi:hypothetical protein